MDDRTRLLVVHAALAAARPLAAALRAGLIVVLYQHPEQLIAVVRFTPGSTAAGTPALVAAASGADAAVLIVHGSPRHTGPLLTALPYTVDQIRAGGVEVAAELAVRDFCDPICWSDLDPRMPCDGTTARPARRSRPPRLRSLLGCHSSAGAGAARPDEGARR